MLASGVSVTPENGSASGVWRALANPVRRHLLDLLRSESRTTGELADALPELSRFAVMQHLGVLDDAGLVIVRRRGRQRFNHLNPVPLREWYERWVVPLADSAGAESLALKRAVEASGVEASGAGTPAGGSPMSVAVDQVRVVRIETELRFHASPERVFAAMADTKQTWFKATYGGDRLQQIVLEPRVGGAHYEDWGDGKGHLYAQITEWDPPRSYSSRGALMPGVILDSTYAVAPDGEETILRVSKVAVGPMSDAEAEGVRFHGDIARFEDTLRKLLEG